MSGRHRAVCNQPSAGTALSAAASRFTNLPTTTFRNKTRPLKVIWTYNALKVRFSATVGEEPKVEVGMV